MVVQDDICSAITNYSREPIERARKTRKVLEIIQEEELQKLKEANRANLNRVINSAPNNILDGERSKCIRLPLLPVSELQFVSIFCLTSNVSSRCISKVFKDRLSFRLGKKTGDSMPRVTSTKKEERSSASPSPCSSPFSNLKAEKG